MTPRAEIVVADPPWLFSSNSEERPGRNPRRHYPCMTDTELLFLPVADWVADDAILFMWTTSPMLERSLPILRTWGFRYVSQLVWVKDRTATGYWVRNRHEPVLIGKRGAFPCPRPAPFPDSVIEAPVREHSRKPPQLQDMIDAVWPDARKLELFARQGRPGWQAWGNQTDRFS
jgi:N6-adenosine-specific RNA methylase IME4